LLTAAAAAVRLVALRESLWLDELLAAWLALGTEGTLTERTSLGNALPPFHWLLQLSVAAFGLSEWSVRLPSIAFGVLVPAAVYLLARAVSGSPWAGRVAGALVVLDAYCGSFGSEARPYPIVQFFGTLQLLAFWALLAGAGGRWRVCYVAGTVVIGYAQPTALSIVGGELAFFALAWARGERTGYPPPRFALDLVVAGVLLLPLAPLVLAINGRRANFWIAARMVRFDDLATFHQQAVYLLYPGVIATAVAFARGVPRPPQPDARADTPSAVGGVVFLLVVFYSTALPVWFVNRIGGPPLFTIRYTSLLVLLPMVAAGLVAARCPSRTVGLAFVAVALALGQCTDTARRRLLAPDLSPRQRSEDWRGAIREVNARGGRLPVFIGTGLIETDGYLASDNPLAHRYLILPVLTIYPLGSPDRPVRSLTYAGDLPTADDVELVRRSGGAWFVVKGNGEFADEAAARAVDRLARAGTRAESIDRAVFLNVVVFRIVCVESGR
jgi:hypothetical protein